MQELTAAKLEASELKLKLQDSTLQSEEFKLKLEHKFEKQEKEIAHK
jgi:hypothetical protein